MTAEQILKRLKTDIIKQSVDVSIPIKGLNNSLIGYLLPIGDWIYAEHDILESIVRWRQKSNRMFPTQTKVTIESTVKYLRASAIDNSTAVLFLIYDDLNKLVGHLGVANVLGDSFELVNLMRGETGGDPRLIYFSEVALIDWCFSNLAVENCCVEVMSYNWLVRALHEEVGFKLFERYFLEKVVDVNGVTHRKVPDANKNVNYTIDKLTLDVNTFYKNINFE